MNKKYILCKAHKCKNYAIKNSCGFCTYHFGLYKRGMITEKGKIKLIRKKKNFHKKCKIKNCNGKPNNQGIYTKGFCQKHYLQYGKGIIDIEGKKLRDLNKKAGPLKRKKSKTTEINKIIRRSSTSFNKALDVTALIEKAHKDKNELLKRIPAPELEKRIKETAKNKDFLQSGKFIFSLIDILENLTINKITVPQLPVKKPGIVSRDEAKIAKLLYNGWDPEDVKKNPKYSKYSLQQIKRIQRLVFIGDRSIKNKLI